MVFPTIMPANSVSGYEISNSLRFNDGDSPKLTKTLDSAGNRRTYTVSTWVKRGLLTENTCILDIISGNDGFIFLIHHSSNKILLYTSESGTDYGYQTDAVFRDPSAWYHIVLAVDTTQGTAANRVILYVNGSEVTFDQNYGEFPENHDTRVNSTVEHTIGTYQDISRFADQYMTEFHFIEGSAKAPTDFGETDDNGVWVPIKYAGTYGTNGYYLEFKQTGTDTNASGIGADTSGNDNHWAVTNLTATDITTDTPTNNFCTLNPAGGINSSGKWTFSEGNTQIQQNNNNNWRATGSTMAVANGKWYWEIEFDAGTMSNIFVGVHDSEVSLEGTNRWVAGSTLFYNHVGGEVRQDGTNTTADYGVLTAGDILGVALNMDDKQISFYDNGNAIVSNFALSSSITGFAMPTFIAYSSNVVYKVNFGNPAYAVSSSNADANGHGNFEYAPPSGYFALCSKNLGQFG